MTPRHSSTRRKFLTASAAAAAAGVAGCSGSSDAGGSGSGTASGAFDPRTEPARVWTTDGADFSAAGLPAATESHVVVPSGSEVVALDAASGAVEWRITDDEAGAVFRARPTIVDGTVYVGDLRNRVRAFDAESGDEQWTRTLDAGVVAAPADSTYGLVVGTTEGHVYVLDRETGETHWRTEVFGGVEASIGADQTRLYVPTTAGELVALGPRGEGAWRRRLGAWLKCPPVVDDGRVFVGSWDENVYALDAQLGSIDWQTSVGAFDRDGGLALAADAVCYAAGRGVGALNRDGSERWSVTFDESVEWRPAAFGDTVLAGNAGELRAFKSDGAGGIGPFGGDRTRWTRTPGDHLGPGVAAADGKLFVPFQRDGAGAVVAFEPQ
ncbi:outer membrane protein assembly factor BamB family protein [Halosimplex sp. J119]